MSVFNTSNLLEENYINFPSIETRSLEESYFLSSLEFCKIMNEEFENSNKVFYKTLLESGNDITIINEGFTEFFEKVRDIVKKFIEFLKKLFTRFSTSLHSLINSDKYIKKNEKEFSKFNSYMEFEMDLYTFTLYESTIPRTNAEDEFKKTFDMLDLMLSADKNDSIVNLSDAEKVTKIKEKYRSIVDNIEDDYDRFRSSIIDGAAPISSSDFSEELFRKFRDGDDTPYETTVTSTIVNNSLIFFKNHEKMIKNVKRIQTDLEREYRNIEKALTDMFSETGTGINKCIAIKPYGSTTGANYTVKATDEIKNELNLIAKSQANKVQQLSAIHSMAFAAKLDAIADCYKQDKKILYKALSAIRKYEGKGDL